MAASDVTAMIEQASAASAFAMFSRCLVLGKGNHARALAVADGLNATDRVKGMLKAAVAAGNDTSASALGTGYASAQAAFVDLLGNHSAFFRIWNAGGFLRVPLRVRIVTTVADATAALVEPGDPIPVSAMRLRGQWLEPRHAAAIVAFSDEVWRDVTASGQNFVNSQLRIAVGRVVDEAFLAALEAETPNVGEADAGDAADLLAGLGRALAAVNTQAGARLFWIAGAQAANRLAVAPGLDPRPSPVGGQLLGLPLVVSPSVGDEQLVLIDAAAVAADLGLIEISHSHATTLNMAPEGEPADIVSLWQTNTSAVRATLTFGLETVQPGALAALTVNGAGDAG